MSDPNHSFYAKVLSVEVPYSFNTLTSPYNTLPYALGIGGGQEYDILYDLLTIPPGNYSIITLLAALTSAIYAKFTQIGLLPANTPSLDFTYNPTTGYATFDFGTIPSTIGMQLRFFWSDVDLLAPFFGFSYLSDMTIIGFDMTGSRIRNNNVSNNNVNCSPVTAIMLRSDTLTQTYEQQECLVEGFFTPSTILLRVPVNFPFNTWILYDNDTFKVKLKNQTIESFDLYFTTLSYDAITFDNVDWRACIEIKEIRDFRYDESQRRIQQKEFGIRTALEDMTLQRGELQDDLSRRVKKLRTSVNGK